MAEYTVTLQRSPTITDAERRRRLATAYCIILECARRAPEERRAAKREAREEVKHGTV